MSDLENLASRAVERGRSSEELEAFLTHERTFQVRVFGGEVDSLSSAEPRGAGFRVFVDGKVGFAFTTDVSEEGLDAAIDRARSNAQYATRDEAAAVAPKWEVPPDDVPGLVDDSMTEVKPESKIAFAVDLERVALGVDDRIRTVEDSVYSDSVGEIAIATSTGIVGGYERSDAWCYCVSIATGGGDTEVGFEFDLARGLDGLSAESVARRSAEKALSVLGAGKIPSARMPVVLDPYVAGQFLGVIGGALTGEAVQKGRSLFAGRLGEMVADERVALVDDGRALGAPAAAPWDDEGIPTRRTSVIANGRLASLLYDLTSARRDGVASTGNASRAGFKSGPKPSPSNLTIEATGETVGEVFARAGDALWVHDFHGVHSGTNPVSGDFSVGVTATLLLKGQPDRPVKEVTIAAPMLDILTNITCVADDRRWLPFGGAFGGATTLVSEMTVAGT